MTKINKKQKESLSDLMSRGGAVIGSQWVNGLGKQTTRRAIPPFCAAVTRREADKQPERIKRVFRQHPRCEYVVAVTDMRNAKKALAEPSPQPPSKGDQENETNTGEQNGKEIQTHRRDK